MTNHTNSRSSLAALAAPLSAHGLEVDLTAHGLKVTNPTVAGCCPGVRRADMVTCRRRRDDGGRPWFFTSWGEPIAESDRITDAMMFIRGYLVGPAQIAGASR